MDILIGKMLKFLFTVSLIAFVLGQVARVQFGNGSAMTLFDISVGIFIAVWLVRMLYEKKSVKDILFFPVLLFFASGTASLIINSAHLEFQQLIVSFLYALRWLVYAALYFAVKDFPSEYKRKISHILLVAGGALVGLGFLQYFFYNNLRNLYYLQWDDHLYRLFSTFLDPNFAGVFFALYLFLLFGKLLDHSVQKKRKYFFIYALLSLLTILALVLTYSRSGLIAFVAGMLVFLFVKGNKKLSLPVFGVVLLFLLIFSNTGVEGRNPFRTASSQERIRSIYIAIRIIEKNPVFGVGFNAYRYSQNRYGFRTSEKWQVSHADAGTDNSWLFVLATTGVVGLLAYVFLWVRVFGVIGGIGGEDKLGTRVVTMASVAGLLASSLFLNTLFYPTLMYWVWVILGITENKKR